MYVIPMDKIIILDFGGQYCHLIVRRIRDAGVFAEVVPSNISSSKIAKDKDIKGVILSGGARSVYEKNAPKFDKKILALDIPILGICYGHQLIAYLLGEPASSADRRVASSKSGEYGLMKLSILKNTGIFSRLPKSQSVWMNHKDIVMRLPKGFVSLASTDHSPVAAYANQKKKILLS